MAKIPEDLPDCTVFLLGKAYQKAHGDFKKRLAEAYWDYFAPMRVRREEILADPGYVDEVLAKGAERAREESAKVLDRIKKAVGLV